MSRRIRSLAVQVRARYTAKYHIAAHAAWLVHAAAAGLVANDRGAEEHWRRTELFNHSGVESVLDLDPAKGFDAAMLHFATIAQDDKLIGHYATSDERRARHVIERHMQTIAELEQRVVTWDYVRFIASRMHLAHNLEDCPADHLVKLARVLDIHIRRLRSEAQAVAAAVADQETPF